MAVALAGWLAVACHRGFTRPIRGANAAIGIAAPDQLVIQVGETWTKQRYFVRKKDIQAMSFKQSLWMKPRKMAHLEIHIRKGNNDQSVSSRYMKADLAKRIMSWYQPLP